MKDEGRKQVIGKQDISFYRMNLKRREETGN
jgi:hypothetical protein